MSFGSSLLLELGKDGRVVRLDDVTVASGACQLGGGVVVVVGTVGSGRVLVSKVQFREYIIGYVSSTVSGRSEKLTRGAYRASQGVPGLLLLVTGA